MRRDCPIDAEAVRRRLKQRLKRKKMSARQLALLTGDDEKNVQRYVKGKSKAIPADFIGRCEAKGFASAQWLLLEKGSPDVVPPSEAVERLTVIGSIAEGQKVSPATLREIQKLIDGPADWVAGGIVEERPEPNSEEE